MKRYRAIKCDEQKLSVKCDGLKKLSVKCDQDPPIGTLLYSYSIEKRPDAFG